MGKALLLHRRYPCVLPLHRRYFGAMGAVSCVEFGSVSSPMIIVPPPNGGSALTGKTGRNIANVCDTIARETTRNTAAHFMFAGLSRITFYRKNFFRDLGN